MTTFINLYSTISQAVERRGEMIVRILEPHSIGGKQAVDAAHKLLAKKDNRHIVQVSCATESFDLVRLYLLLFHTVGGNR